MLLQTPLDSAAVASQPADRIANQINAKDCEDGVSQCVNVSRIRERFLTKNVKEATRSDSKSRCDNTNDLDTETRATQRGGPTRMYIYWYESM